MLRATALTTLDLAVDVWGGVREGNGAVDALKKSPPSVLRKLCERMGATYIKVRRRLLNLIGRPVVGSMRGPLLPRYIADDDAFAFYSPFLLLFSVGQPGQRVAGL